MPASEVSVFDFDGTLIRVNSFKEVNKRLLLRLVRKGKVRWAGTLAIWYLLRKAGLISHMRFKKRAVAVFEMALSESEKTDLVQEVFDENVNEHVYAIIQLTENCVISTSAPFAYMSRIAFGREVMVISSLEPEGRFPDAANFGAGKVRNLRAITGDELTILNAYTDSLDDEPLMACAKNAYLVSGERIERYKGGGAHDGNKAST